MNCPNCGQEFPDSVIMSIKPWWANPIYCYCENCHTVHKLEDILNIKQEKNK